MKAVLALIAMGWIGVLSPTASAQPSESRAPRVYGVVRWGPLGQTVVRTPTRQLEGGPVAAPGFGLRVDVPALSQLHVGMDLGMLFEGENLLHPYGPMADGSELQLDGFVLDLLVSARPVLKLDRERIELFASGGVGVTWRPDVSGELPVTDVHGATTVETHWSMSGWGVLAQLGAGATFWLNDAICVMFEAALIARRVNLFGDTQTQGSHTVVVDELHGVVMSGAGATWRGL